MVRHGARSPLHSQHQSGHPRVTSRPGGCCTSTSTSSSPRSRCSGDPSWPACPSSSAAAVTRPSGAWWRPRRTPPASTASAPACRCGLRRASCPDAVFLPVDKPAYDEAEREVMAILRVVPGAGGRGARLGRGVPGRRDRRPRGARPRRSSAGARRAPGCTARWGSATTSCRPRSRPASASRAGIGRLTYRPLVRGDGGATHDALWGIGPKTATTARGARDPHGRRARSRRHRRARRASSGPTMGPWYRRLGRGVDSSPVDPTPWVARAHGRETTFQTRPQRLGEVAAEARRLAAQVAEDIAREGRPGGTGRGQGPLRAVRAPVSAASRCPADDRRRRASSPTPRWSWWPPRPHPEGPVAGCSGRDGTSGSLTPKSPKDDGFRVTDADS